MIEKVGICCRLSYEDRDKKNVNDDSDSIQNQKSMLLKYAMQNGWEVVDIYSDDNYSGAGTYRPEFERMIKDCESGRINLVLCKTQSRFSRDMEVIEKYLHNKFPLWGVRFVSVVDNADTEVRGNKKSRQINGLINEWYLEELSDNIKKSLSNKRDDGLYMGSFAPYGYIKCPENRHKLIVDEEAAEVVRKIFEYYKNGLGYLKICQALDAEKIDSPIVYKKKNGSKITCPTATLSESKWGMDAVARILRNQVYIGDIVQGKRTTISYKHNKKCKSVDKKNWNVKKNTHESIIDMDTWLIVQQRLGKHESPTRTGEVHFFSQKVYCEECEKIFNRNVYKVKGEPDGRRVHLQCRGARIHQDCKNKKSIRMEHLENAVIKEINLQIKKFYNQESLERQYNKKTKIKNKCPDRIKILELEKLKTERKTSDQFLYYRNLYEDKINKVISELEFMMLKVSYLKDIESANKRVKAIEEELEILKSKAKRNDNIMNILNKYKNIKKLDRVIIDELIDKIYIGNINEETKERNIIIEWNIKELAQ